MLKNLIKFFSLLELGLRNKIYIFSILSLCVGLLEMLGIGLIYPIANFIFSNNDQVLKYLPFQEFIAKLSPKSITEVLILIFVLSFAIKNILLLLINSFLCNILAAIRHDLSCSIFNKYVFLDYSFFLDKNSGEITRNLTSIINDLNTAVILPIGLLFTEASILIFIAIIVLYLNFTSSLLMLGAFIIPFYFYNKVLKNKLRYYGEEGQISESFRIEKINQMIGGIKEIKILNKESFFVDWYKKYDAAVANSHKVINTYTQMNRYFLEIILIISISLFIFYFMKAGNLDFKSMIPFLALYIMAAFKVMPSLNRINNSLQALSWSGKVIEIVNEILKTKSRTGQIQPKKVKILNFKNSIVFKNVSFRYSKNSSYVLRNLNLSIKKGSIIGIKGASGSGKSTILNLLLGILKPTKGYIRIDGSDIHKVYSGHNHIIGFVPQDVFLSDDSILSNVAFGTPLNLINKDRVIRCLKDAKIYDFVIKLKYGLNTKVGDRGVRLSGGQKQRLAIARSLFFGAEILVFDEATSALDSKTESEIMRTINDLDKTFTIIIVAHRLNTLRNCEKLYEIHDGTFKLNLNS
jgi:ABC-type multidrug transport system fused ATPase/permease subunit